MSPAFDLTADPLRERILALAIQAKDMLPPAELHRRQAWCAVHHDTLTATPDAGGVVVTWGGDPLLTLDEPLLRKLRDEEHVDLALSLAPDLPEDVSSLDGGTL